MRRQTPLWGSTGTKNPDYSDVLYVEALIGKESINTLPDATLAAFRDHGRVEDTLGADIAAAQLHFFALTSLGIAPDEIGETLQADGVRIFAEAFDKLLAAV